MVKANKPQESIESPAPTQGPTAKGARETMIEAAMEEMRLQAQELARQLPEGPAPKKIPTVIRLENGHLEALKQIPRLSALAMSFLNAFKAIDNFVTDYEVKLTCKNPEQAVKELEPYFAKYAVKWIRTGSGWAITKNLNAVSK